MQTNGTKATELKKKAMTNFFRNGRPLNTKQNLAWMTASIRGFKRLPYSSTDVHRPLQTTRGTATSGTRTAPKKHVQVLPHSVLLLPEKPGNMPSAQEPRYPNQLSLPLSISLHPSISRSFSFPLSLHLSIARSLSFPLSPSLPLSLSLPPSLCLLLVEVWRGEGWGGGGGGRQRGGCNALLSMQKRLRLDRSS